MDVLYLLILSPIIFFIGQFLNKKIKIAPPIFYLLLGILFGGSAGICHIFGNNDVLPNLANYNTIAMLLMFFGAGFGLDLKSMKNSGKVTTKLCILPVHVEAIIMTVIVFLGLKLVPSLGFNLSIFEVAIVMILVTGSSPANIIPISMGHNAAGYTGKNRITDNMIAVSVVDNFIVFPILVLALVFTVAPKMGMEFTAIKLILLILGMFVGFAVLILMGVFIGFISTKILHPIGKKVADARDNKLLPILYVLLYFTILAFIVNFSGPLKSFGIVVAVAVGVGVKKYEKNGLANKININSSMLFAIFGMPIIFAYVGSLINLKTLLNPTMLIFGVIIIALACTTKALVIRYILRDEKYTDGERKYAMSCFIAKGVALVNFSLIFMGIFTNIGLKYVVDFMITLAPITIIGTIPLSVTLISNAGGKWLTKNNNDNKPETKSVAIKDSIIAE